MSNKPTIRSLAKELNLSTAAVSMALRQVGRLSEATRERVLAHARERGYAADPLVAEGMARARRGDVFQENLACLWDVDPLNLLWVEGFRASRDQRAADLGYQVEDRVVDFDTPRELEREFRVLRARGVRGIILAPMLHPRTELKLDLQHFAWVGIGFSVPEPGIRRVTRDLRRDIQRCVRALEEKGCRRIGFVESSNRAALSGDVLQAYALAWHARAGWPLTLPYYELEEGEDEAGFRTWLDDSELEGLVFGQAVESAYRDCVPNALPKVNLTLPGIPHRDPGCMPHFARSGIAAIDLIRNMLTHNEFGLPDHGETIVIESHWIEAGATIL
ncbi:MAG: LacI family DNA-binding transcriptional regulator [Kiritimatiellia bacterium]